MDKFDKDFEMTRFMEPEAGINSVELHSLVDSDIDMEDQTGYETNFFETSVPAPDKSVVIRPVPCIRDGVGTTHQERPPSDRTKLINVLKSINGIQSTRPKMEEKVRAKEKETIALIKTRQNENLVKLREKKAREKEINELKARIARMKAENETIKAEFAAQKEEQTRILEAKKREVAASEAKKKREAKKLAKANKKLEISTAKLEKLTKTFKKILDEDKRLMKWCESHGLSVYVVPTTEDSDPNSPPSVVLILEKLLPNNPEKSHHIRLESVSFESKTFIVKNVLPHFEGANELVEKANVSLDMCALITECVRHWKSENVAVLEESAGDMFKSMS